MKIAHMLLAAALFLILGASPAGAMVTTVNPTPQRANIAFSPASGTITVTWVITRTTVGGPVTLTANPGVFRLSAVGPILATTPARTRVYSGNPGTLTFVET